MPITFQSVPQNVRIPFAYAEFNNTNAKQGTGVQPYTVLIIGQRLSAGTKAALSINPVTTEAQAREYFGAGSQLFTMVKAFREQNKNTPLYAIPVADDASGVASSGSVLFAGTATDSGSVNCYIGGELYQIGVVSGDTAADVCSAMVDKITDDVDAIVTVAIDGTTPEKMNITARNKGVFGDEIDVRFNHYETEETVDGITHTITSMTGGAVNPDIETVIAVMNDVQYNAIITPWTDTTNLDALDAELEDRFGPERQKQGTHFTCKRDSYADLLTFGGARNSKNECIPFWQGPSSPWDAAAQIAAEAVKQAEIDPAVPIQNLPLTTMLAPQESERFTETERNLLLYDGISTSKVVNGKVLIERLITTYQLNAAGADDESYLRIETMNTLSYIRYDYVNSLQTKYPNSKLGNDGTRYGGGQRIVTPQTVKLFAISKFAEWESRGLVENPEQFADDLIIERNSSNPDRLDHYLAPDLINQMRVHGIQIGFLL